MKSILILLALMSVSVTSNEKWSWGESEHHPTRTGKSSQTTLVFSDNTDQSKDILKSILEPAPEKTEIRAASTRQSRKIDVPKPKVSDAAYTQGDTHTSSTQGDGHVSHAQGDGQSEARFSKFKKGLCKYGIGINCPKGYDYIEVEQPYEEVQGYGAEYGYGGAQGGGYGGVGGYGAGYETAGIGQYGGGGGAISPHQVLQVQPVALQAVGAPIAAVPLGPGGSYGGGAGDIYGGGVGGGLNHGGAIASGGHGGALIGGGHGGGVGGGYGGVVNNGYGGGHGVVNQGYGVSQGGFGGGAVGPAFSGGHGGVVSQGYSAPAATYGAPAATYGAPPAPEYISPPGHGLTQVEYAGSVYEEPFAELELQEEIKPQVVNHYHTHTHIHQGQGSGSYAKDDSPYSGSHVSETINNSPPKRHTSVSDFGNSFSSREDCECVPNYFCPSSDVIGRHSDTPRLDARNKPTDILSTASDTKTSSSTKSQIRENPPKTKSKREIRSTFKVINEKESMGRQAHGTSRIRNTRQSQEKKCSRGEVCCKNQGFKSRELSYSCGKKNAAGVLGRVKSSVIRETGDTQFGEYPWQAAILKREAGEVIYVCGGALVNDRHIVTAAHCVNTMNPSELKVRLGEWDVNRKSEFYDHIEVNVNKIVIHPTFYSGTLVNDIAIIILDEDVQFKKYPHINPICLPNPKSDFTNKHCHVTGWGKDAFGSDGAFQYILKEVEVPVWGHGSCEKSLRETRLGRTYELDSGMLCAGGEEGKDACKGDGGGPLVCPGADGSMELGGIVSWGIGCGERGIPGVYVNIPYYMEWITKVLQS